MKHSQVELLTLCIVLLVHTFAVALDIETLPVGHPGNAPHGLYGGVDYIYRIGKFEVTNGQYAEFLNNVDANGTNALALFDARMSSDVNGGIVQSPGAAAGQKYAAKAGYEQKPVAWVSWYDSLRFANWMHNGQGAGDTESGAYALLGGTPTPSNATVITRNPNARWALSSEDEWVKAAYHKNDGDTGNYYRYPNSSDARSYSDKPGDTDAPDLTRVANVFRNDGAANGYNDGYAVTGTPTFPSVTALTDVGSYQQTVTPYGAMDMTGNLVEWNDAILRVRGNEPLPGIRGDSYWTGSFGLNLDDRDFRGVFNVALGSFSDRDIGFRVVHLIPEPSALGLLAASMLLLSTVRMRR